MVYTAAVMYGSAALDAVAERLVPGDPTFAATPALGAFAIAIALVLLGPRLPLALLALAGPLGACLIAVALASTPTAGDGAVLYVWPTLWSTFFFRRRGAITVVSCIAVAHALALFDLPQASSSPGRWIDVVMTVSLVAIVTLMLLAHNDRLLRRLAGEARTDELTGLLNRRGLEERAVHELARARREGGSIAVVMLDLDHFKLVNDEWGHDVGDRVLTHTATVLASHCRDIDITARYGGEEFLVLLPGSDSADADVYTHRVREALAAGNQEGLPIVSLSAGVIAAAAPSDLAGLIRRADSALYEAKRSGRDRTVIFKPVHTLLPDAHQPA